MNSTHHVKTEVTIISTASRGARSSLGFGTLSFLRSQLTESRAAVPNEMKVEERGRQSQRDERAERGRGRGGAIGREIIVGGIERVTKSKKVGERNRKRVKEKEDKV